MIIKATWTILAVVLISVLLNMGLAWRYFFQERELRTNSIAINQAMMVERLFLPALMNRLGVYAQEDKAILDVLRKYFPGIALNPNPPAR